MTERRCICTDELSRCSFDAAPDGYCDFCRPGPDAGCPAAKKKANQ